MDDATKAVIFGQVRGLLIFLGTLLSAHGLIGPPVAGHPTITPENWQFIVGAIVTLGPMVWSAWDHIRAAKTAKEKQAIAVQAGINLVHEGASILIEDETGKQVPKPVTTETAAAIVKNFGPTPDEIAQTQALNLQSLNAAKGNAHP